MLQNGAERRMTAANHGFPDGQGMYHAHPLGRRIGQIVMRQLDWNIALSCSSTLRMHLPTHDTLKYHQPNVSYQ